MDKKYTLISAIRGGRPRSKRLQKLGVGSGSTVVVSPIQGNAGASSDGHTHDNKSDLDRISTDGEGYEYITRTIQSADGETDETSIQTVTEKVKAGYADKAGDLTEDSPVRKLINTIGNQFVPTYLDGSAYVETTWAEIVAGTRTLAAIKSVKGFFSDSFISARGANPDEGGSGGGGVYYLHELLDAAINNPTSGQALVYNGTTWVNQAIQTGLDEAALASYLTTHSYATQSWVESKGYLTTHQSLADYVTLNTPQNITANKAFYGEEKFIVGGGTYTDPWSGIACAIKVTGKVGITDSIKAASFIKANGTASQFLMADGNVATKHVLTASNNLGWDGTQGQIPTIDTLAFWNGRYNATNSNLQYCDRGRFGTMAVANAADYLARAGGSMLNTSLVTNLNADLLDGKHSYAFANRCNLDYTTGTSVGDFCKANADTRNAGNILSASGWAWANSRTLKLNDSYSIDNQRYSCITYRNGDLNGTWQQQALLFLPTYSDSNMIYLAQMVVEGTAGSVKTSIKRYADYDTVLASNVASATKLADNTAVKAWGQVFFENGKPKGVSGNMTGVGSITRSNASAVDTDAYGNLKFKSASATTWHIDNMSGAALFAFLSSGNAGIGTATPAYKLDVNGTARVSSLIIGDITLSYDAANGGLHVSGGGLYADSYITARGANTSGSGSTGGGLIQQVYGSSSLGGAFSDTTLTDTFNAYTINKIRTDLINADSALSGRITSLEGGAAVNVTTTGSGNAITAISKSGTTITATKGSTFLTAHQSLANYVTLNTTQTITGAKSFNGTLTINTQTILTGAHISMGSSIGNATYDKYHRIDFGFHSYDRINIYEQAVNFFTNGGTTAHTVITNTGLTAPKFIKSDGTASQFLKADGSVDGNTYLTTSAAASAYQPKGNYVPWSKQSVATVNGTNHNPQFFNIENENLIANYKNYWSVINFGSYSGNNFRSQIAMPYQDSITDTDMFIRTANGSNWRAWRRVLHDGNYSSVLDSRYYTESEADARFVNVTGDTMTGLLTAKVGATHTGIKLGNTYLTANDGNVILQNIDALRFGSDTWQYNQWAGLKYNSDSKTVYLGIADGDIFTAYPSAQSGGNLLTPGISNIYVGNNTTNKVWHAGNDGSGSGLDTDYLDGYHESAFLRQGVGRLSTTAAFDIRRTCTNELYNYNPYSFDEGYGTIVTFSSGGVNFAGQFYLPRLGGSHISYRGKNDTNNTWAAWSKLAFLTDNVASATKLQTARTLWGQSFNGTANVDGALTVHHTGACGVYISGGGESSYSCQASGGLRWVSGAYPDRYFIWDSSGNGNERLTILNNGSVGIGTTSPSAKLDVIGVIHSTAGIWSNGYVSARGQNTASDARLKTIMQTMLLDTKSIAAAPSVLFSWKDDGREDVGSIAQYWQRIDRHLVSHRPDGYLGLDYGKAALLSVISVAKQTLNHEARIKALENENARLKEQIKSLT